MARQLGDLPGRQVGEDAAGQRPALRLQPLDLLGDVDARIDAEEPQLLDLASSSAIGCSNSRKFIAMKTVSSPRVIVSRTIHQVPARRAPPAPISLSSSSRVGRTDQASRKIQPPRVVAAG